MSGEKAKTIDEHLRQLIPIVDAFELRQDGGKWTDRLLSAVDDFKKSPLIEPGFAGSTARQTR